jgi:hypothetical protein
LTVPLNPEGGVIAIAADVEPPVEAIVKLLDDVETATVAPVPFKLTVCGEPLALSVIVSDPVPLPVAVGVNVTEMTQFAPAATLVPQVLVWANSPDAAMEVIARGAVPELVRVTVWAALVEPSACEANVRFVGESVTEGAVVTCEIPVPVNGTA